MTAPHSGKGRSQRAADLDSELVYRLDFSPNQRMLTAMESKYSGLAVFVLAIIGIAGFVGGIAVFFDSICLLSCTAPQSPMVADSFGIVVLSFLLLVFTCILAICVLKRNGEESWALAALLAAGLPVIFSVIVVPLMILTHI